MPNKLDPISYLEIIDLVNRFTLYADHQEWDKLRNLMANSIWIDYSDLDREPPSRVDLQILINSWREQANEFEAIQHMISNHCVDFQGQHRAKCRAHAQIYRTLPNNKGGSYWTIGGTYEFSCTLIGKDWRIERIHWRTLWSEGNANILDLAFEKGQKTLDQDSLTADYPAQNHFDRY